ncbi:hypothetical protein Pan110_48370 [Gimesia panareensis]|nr:hypothetical protein Pan110_48370 [Gimesia panareensis]
MWRPREAKISLQGENTDPVQSEGWINRENNVRLFFWWVVLFIIFDVWAILYLIKKWGTITSNFKNYLEEKYIGSGEIEVAHFKKWFKTLHETQPIQNGESASDLYESFIKNPQAYLEKLSDSSSNTPKIEDKTDQDKSD